ncbi:MAG: T9SS type A sorting domain-containing protein, partial [Bacteroidales bacterium]|nr:T9SS type A sorting domain-containing protein [Bacteroidales bacterium]
LWYGIAAFDYTEPEIPDDTTGIIHNTPSGALRCFPNPAREIVHFELDNARMKEALLKIYDLTGNLVHSEMIMDRLSFRTEGLSPGTYYYQCHGMSSILSGKFVLLN